MDELHVHDADREKRAVGRTLRFALIGSVALAVVLLVLLASVTANSRLFESHYRTLLWLTVGVAAGLFVLVLELLRRLVQRYRRGLFGTRLMARMAASFTLMTVVPLALIYLVAVQFVGRSVESWFAVPVERALESGIALARTTLDAMLADLSQKARAISAELVERPQQEWPAVLNRLSVQIGVQDALIVSGTGRLVAASGTQLRLIPDPPPSEALRRARQAREYSAVEPGEDGTPESLLFRVILVIGAERPLADDSRYLQLTQPVPRALAENAEAVDRGRRDFQALQLSREALLRLYRITLTLIFLLTAFAAVAASFLLSGWLTGPLSMLAAGTRAVAEGDYRPVKDYVGRDELGVLTQSFNVMTRQLEDARLQVERNQRELERANARLESVLSNLTGGVLVLDSDFRLVLANAGAERILGVSMAGHLGSAIAEVPRLDELAEQIRAAFDEQAAAGDASWQRQFVLPRPAAGTANGQGPAFFPMAPDATGAGGGIDQTLLARGSILPESRVGYVVVFDDISGVISAQRAVAWAEVARRLAHEIKNPLTPIQLAAERMRHKLADRLPPAEAELLAKSSQTIVNQVAALKHMVDEFRDYARLPAARLEPVDLNALVDDVLRLYPSGDGRTVIAARLGSDLPRILGDPTQLRQVIHNLVKNAQEATEKVAAAHIEIVTERIERADGGIAVRASIADNGGGFPETALARVFEPYVTSKTRGTGLGLAIVRKIIDEHGARIEVGNLHDAQGEPMGARIVVLFTKLAKSGENRRLAETQHD